MRRVVFAIAGAILWLVVVGLSFGATNWMLLDQPIVQTPVFPKLAPVALPANFRFTADAPGIGLLRSGWSSPEPWGVWTDGPKAIVQLPGIQLPDPLRPPEKFELALKLQPYLPPGMTSREVIVRVSDMLVGVIPFDGSAVNGVVLPLHRNMALSFDDIIIQFEILKPSRPADFGPGNDKRQLGIGLIEAEIGAKR
jgi:hypothetical protein